MATKRKNLEEFIQNLKKTHKDGGQACKFDDAEIEALIEYFKALTGPNKEKMDGSKFRDEFLQTKLEITDDFLMDRVFRAFDRDNDGYLNKEEWILGLHVFFRGELEDKLKHCFLVYDLNSDGYISREEMFHLLKNCLIKPSEEDPDEGVKELVEIVLKKMDQDRDGRVSLSDYRAAINLEPLLVEVLGACLPSQTVCDRFLRSLRPGGGVNQKADDEWADGHFTHCRKHAKRHCFHKTPSC